MSTAKQAKDWATSYSVDRARVLFENDKSGKAFHAWEAYRWSRWNDQPIPGWVLEYLDSVAKTLKEENPRNAKEVAQALGMATKGRYPKSSLSLKESARLGLFQSVMVIKGMKPDRSYEDIFIDLAEERGVSKEQVRDSYYEFKS